MGEVFRLQKRRSVPCELGKHPFGWELRLDAAGEMIQTQVCRSPKEWVELFEEWKSAMLEKGWSAGYKLEWLVPQELGPAPVPRVQSQVPVPHASDRRGGCDPRGTWIRQVVLMAARRGCTRGGFRYQNRPGPQSRPPPVGPPGA